MDVYATSEHPSCNKTNRTQSMQRLLNMDLKAILDVVVFVCTNTYCIEDLAWSKVSSERAHEFYMYSKEFLKTVNDDFCIDLNPELPNATNTDVNKMCKFLEICNEYEATLLFC